MPKSLLLVILLSLGATVAHADPSTEIIRACGKVSKVSSVVNACLEHAYSVTQISACGAASQNNAFLKSCFKSRLSAAAIAACAKVSQDLNVQMTCLAQKPRPVAAKKEAIPVSICLVSVRCEKVAHQHGGVGSESEFEILNSNPDGVRFTLVYKENGRREIIRSEERSYFNCYDCSAKSFVREWNKELPGMMDRCEAKAQKYRDGLDACPGAIGQNDRVDPSDVSNQGLVKLEEAIRDRGLDPRNFSPTREMKSDQGI